VFVFALRQWHNQLAMQNLSDKLASLRRDYVSQPLTESSVAAEPFAQFQQWFDDALAAEQPDPEAMTLSTVNETGRVAARIVLLKGCDAHGFTFFTNYESRKGRELLAHPQAALTFYWHALNRQIRIEGRVEKVSAEVSEAYFQTRPLNSRLGAWASPQSQPIESRAWLEARVAAASERFAQAPLSCPPFWGGFLLRPDAVEFWQGRESRLHDRMVYTLTENGWQLSRLAP
jgi:pyridoxamine 5'-phosphate oxidase